MMFSRSLSLGKSLLTTTLLGLVTLGNAQAQVFTMSAELHNAFSVGAPAPAPFVWDRMDGILIGEPTLVAAPNVLDCFAGICDISSMSMDFSNGGTPVAHFNFTLAEASTTDFTGLMDGSSPVRARFTDFVYEIVNGECSGRTDTFCFAGALMLADALGNPFMEFSWLDGLNETLRPPGMIDSIYSNVSDPCLGDCGRFDVDFVNEPGPIALMSIGLAGLAVGRQRKTAA